MEGNTPRPAAGDPLSSRYSRPVLPLLAAARALSSAATVPSPLPAGALRPFHLTKADAPAKIDGVLDDPAWEKAAADIAFEWMPGENSTPVRTEVLLATTTRLSTWLSAVRSRAGGHPGSSHGPGRHRHAHPRTTTSASCWTPSTTSGGPSRLGQPARRPTRPSTNRTARGFSWRRHLAIGRPDRGIRLHTVNRPSFQPTPFSGRRRRQTWGFEADRSYPRNIRHRMSTHPHDRDRICILCQFNTKSPAFKASPRGLISISADFDRQPDRRRFSRRRPRGCGEANAHPA